MRILIPALVVVSALFLSGPVFSEEPASKGKETEKATAYVGAAKCKMCHSKEATGDQYKLWKASPHAGAFETLASEQAMKVAKEAGVEGNPQESAACLGCHTTGATAAADLTEKLNPEDGVSCEACHGPGADYQNMKVMKAIFAGETDPASVGLMDPSKELCQGCHNEKSPTFKSFDFEKAVAKIAHPYPKEAAATQKSKS